VELGADNEPFLLHLVPPWPNARGASDSARERSRTGLAMARELSHVGTILNELPFGGIVNQLCGGVVAVREIAESSISLSSEHGFPHWLPLETY
jgi:hypothetical protein